MKKLTILFLFLLFLGCATTGPGGKKSLILISSNEEVSIGEQMAAQVEKEEKVLGDTLVQQYVNNIGHKIAGISDRKELPYNFKVLESDQINAFACPGGYIYVYSGLLKIVEDEAELAGVLSHEISHVVARHGIKRLQQVLGLQVLLSIALGSSSETNKQVISTGIGLVLQGYSRDNEYEADQYGTYYLMEAGYNPAGMRNLLNKFDQLSSKEPSFFEKLVATHPPMKERVAKVETQISGYGKPAETLPYKKSEYDNIKSRLK
ncbi:MAG: M48 family metallopeptidase [candidate division Zixibacteria bacterium]|nr:M48 family metallopeptidase [candidate division Zixibacteria bacterium]